MPVGFGYPHGGGSHKREAWKVSRLPPVLLKCRFDDEDVDGRGGDGVGQNC